jgi:signal peptidase I
VISATPLMRGRAGRRLGKRATRSAVTKKNKPAESKRVERKPKETAIEFLSSLAAVLVTGLFIITFVAQAFEIPSSSMESTLLVGDHVFVNRIQLAPKTSWMGALLPYGDPRFRDIVVFLSPVEPGLYLGKRIIGIPGDRIRLRNGVVYRNGIALNEPYVDHDQDNLADLYRNNFPAVPPTDDAGVYPVLESIHAVLRPR